MSEIEKGNTKSLKYFLIITSCYNSLKGDDSMNKYTDKQKQGVIERYANGESVSDIVSNCQIPRSTIYSWIKEDQNNNGKKKEVNLRNFRALEKKVNRLEGIVEILQNIDCTANSPLDIKLAALEELYGQYSVHMICDALKVPRGTFYNHIFRNKRDNTWYSKRREEFRIRIQEIYDENNQIFGAAKITAIMKEEGYHISIGMVRELMQDMGLISIRQDAKDLYDKEQKKYKNHLNQEFTATRPNEIWVSDVTYFRYKEQVFYICAILDLYSRMVVGFRISHKNSTQLTKGTFKQAYENRKPENNLLFHTDRGSNYRSKTFCSYLKSLGVTQSFSRAHVPYDNSVMESFFSSLKREELYRTKYRSENEFRTAVKNYMIFYNEKRSHAKNGYKTPAKRELEFFSKQTKKSNN